MQDQLTSFRIAHYNLKFLTTLGTVGHSRQFAYISIVIYVPIVVKKLILL